MRQHLIRSALVLSSLVAFGLWGCGTTGSDMIQFPEVRFEVRPAGKATFHVDSLIGGGVSHASISGPDQTFTATAAFDFVLENAAPPYKGVFTSQDQITVTLTVISGAGQTQVTDSTAPPGKTTATVVTGGTPPMLTPGPASPEVRFDVCAPQSGTTSCSTTADPAGSFGILFSGTLGDPVTSHLLSGTTPTIYFLEAPRDNVNAVFTRQPFTNALLVAQLLINGQPQQTQASAHDIVIRQDL